ncbi:hypothetical protein GCM10007414_10940 [Agarivorans gilvus]|uniref:L,D-TPase catalytic domain-containing protein n=2 Tax=Agarivorans gilvus TaxID=680279 RepID=A0ABQ1I018_9ALTE|nr:hypothetical protein GCM10007414_10940 [Agarivorans gilvus]
MAVMCFSAVAQVDLLGPDSMPFETQQTEGAEHSVLQQASAASGQELAVGERLLSRLSSLASTKQRTTLVSDSADYRLYYPQLQQSIYHFHPESLWYDYPQARNARDQLQWLLLEFSLAGGPKQLDYWLEQINAIDSEQAQWEGLFTDAFLGVLAFYQQLQTLDYAQSMALNEIGKLGIPLVLDELWLVRLNRGQIYQYLADLRGELNIERLQYRQQILYWLHVRQQRQLNQDIVAGRLIRLGDEDPRLPTIRLRLSEFDPSKQFSAPQSLVMDQQTEQAIKHFQQLHGLKTDGIVGKETLYWLNYKPLQRAKMLARNLLRKQLFTRFVMNTEQQRIIVNLPAYQMTYQAQGVDVFQSRVVVGRASRATPLLVSEISSVVVNPYWNVPRTIVRKDIVPMLRRDPSYVERKGFELFDYQGQAVSAEQVDWPLLKDTGYFPYRMRQRPGPGNALGAYKFHFDNQYAVYLHDTSSPELFTETERAFSSGCIRVEAADFLAETLLEQAGYSHAYKQSLLAKQQHKWLPLRHKVPVYMVYFTSWFDHSGGLHYRKDIYNFSNEKKV